MGGGGGDLVCATCGFVAISLRSFSKHMMMKHKFEKSSVLDLVFSI
jgi:hypothetical protein